MKTTRFITSVVLVLILFETINAQTRAIFGSTVSGGKDDMGVVFRTDANVQNQKNIHEFALRNIGNAPVGELVELSQGVVLGVTSKGGTYDKGVLFEYTISSDVYTIRYTFGAGSGAPYSMNSGLMKMVSGKIYGVSQNGGASNAGVVFEYDPVNFTVTTLASFSHSTTGSSYASTPQEYNGKLYGTRGFGGSTGSDGTIYVFDPADNSLNKVGTFNGTNGSTPTGHLFLASNNRFYGMTTYGGSSNDYGALYEFNPATNTLTKKITFNGTNGRWPSGSFVENGGKLYGLTYVGGKGDGVLFEYTLSNGNIQTLFDFADGVGSPLVHATLVDKGSGVLYGVNNMTGGQYTASVYSFTISTSKYTEIARFTPDQGAMPYGSMMRSSDNRLYGLMLEDGGGNCGTLYEFQVASKKVFKKLDFNFATDGANPTGQYCLFGSKIFGMTTNGGASNFGVIFEIDPLNNNTFTKRYDFEAAVGGLPTNGLLVTKSNKVFGMTIGGIFEFDPVNYTASKKVAFTTPNGTGPRGNLIEASNGKLYGMTEKGGSNNYGVVFEFDPATSNYVKILDFTGPNGAYPTGDLIEVDGKLYGMTYSGGDDQTGALFSIELANKKYTLIYSFDFLGYRPIGSFAKGVNGKLYALASTDKYSYLGKLIEFDIATGNVEIIVFPASIISPDNVLNSSLLQASNGRLYGMSRVGGTAQKGHIFYVDPVQNVADNVRSFQGTNGSIPADNSRLFEVNISEISGIKSMHNLDVSIYPIPVKNQLNIDLNEDHEDMEIEIFNLQGVKVYSASFKGQKGSVDMALWTPGVYIIKVVSGNQSHSRKLIKAD